MSKKTKKKSLRGSHPDESYEAGTVKNLHLDKEVKALSNLSFKTNGKETPVNVQIANYLKAMRLIESELLIRLYINNALHESIKINETLTRDDKAEIRRLARREIDLAYREELKLKITKEVEKILKGKVNQDIVLDISKKILKKFHRELYFDYTPVISRLKI
ncbi:hypothetical protein OAA09_00845 [bacterium]|nr:hypothetical protein [bacterium]